MAKTWSTEQLMQEHQVRRIPIVDGEGRCIGIVSQADLRSEEHTSELQSRSDLVCRLLLEKKKKDRFDDARQDEDDHADHNDHRDGREGVVRRNETSAIRGVQLPLRTRLPLRDLATTHMLY